MRSRVTLLVVCASSYAAFNLTLALVLLRQPSRAADLQVMYDWCSRWLRQGENLYASVASSADYPPNAIVTFSPVALIPPAALIPVWAAIGVFLIVAFAYVVVKTTAPRAAVALPVLLFLCWGGARMLLQFSSLSLTLAFAAILWVDSRSVLSGVLLGAALAKPQLAGPIALWMLLTRRWRPVVVAGAVVLIAFAIYLARAHAAPVSVLGGYAAILRDLYGDPSAFAGRTGLRRWVLALAGDSAPANAAWVAVALFALLVPCAAAVESRAAARSAAAVPAMFCLWSLLVWFHLGNNLALLMFPTFAFLLLVDDPETERQRHAAAALVQISLMLDLSVHLSPYASRLGPLDFLVIDADRFVVLGTFWYVAWLWRGLTADSSR